jgi:hypothetical protein
MLRPVSVQDETDLRNLLVSLTKVDNQLDTMRSMGSPDKQTQQQRQQQQQQQQQVGSTFDNGSPSRFGMGVSEDPVLTRILADEFAVQGIDYSRSFSASGFKVTGMAPPSSGGLGATGGAMFMTGGLSSSTSNNKSMLGLLRQAGNVSTATSVAGSPSRGGGGGAGRVGGGLGVTDNGLVMGAGLELEADAHPVLASFRARAEAVHRGTQRLASDSMDSSEREQD